VCRREISVRDNATVRLTMERDRERAGIVTRLSTGQPRRLGSIPGRSKRFVSSPLRPAVGLTHPPIQLVLEAVSPPVKRQGRDADHSPPFSVEVENSGTIPPLSYASSWRGA
jgi:hypothetical protein